MTDAKPRLLAFRFDVDSVRCIREGVPALLNLAGRLNVRFTFFVNMGRAVDRCAMLRRAFGSSGRNPGVRLSAKAKLGSRWYAVTALLNPKVGAGAGAGKVIRRAVREGHEVGLHGGRNHGSWQAGAGAWTFRRYRKEVVTARRWLLQAMGGVGRVQGFASPGWVGDPKKLWPVLVENGFDYVADRKGRLLEPNNHTFPLLWSVPTHLTGEPGGVAYLEHNEAAGRTDDDLLADFQRALHEAQRRCLVLYDHPYYAGTRKRELLARMIDAGRMAGYRIGTLSEVLSTYRAGQ